MTSALVILTLALLAACGHDTMLPTPTPILPTMTATVTMTPTYTPTATYTPGPVIGAVWTCMGGRCTTSAR